MNKSTFFGIIAVIFILLSGWFVYSSMNRSEVVVGHNDYINKNILSKELNSSLRQNNPKDLQEYLLNDIKAGKNDEGTKSAMYFISHRYFDNQGDIYEIYDYVQAHPEISFLNKAENIYPSIFAKIKSKQVQKADIESMFALLAYMEVGADAGYGDVATYSTLASKYAEMADTFTNTIKKGGLSDPVVKNYSGIIENSKARSLKFSLLAEKDVSIIMSSGTDLGIAKQDVLVGLNQYAHALAYYQKLGWKIESKFTMIQVFEYANQYAFDNTRDFYVFSNYLYAASLVLTGQATSENVSRQMKVVVSNSDPKSINLLKYGIESSIITAKDNPKRIGDASLDKVIKLAKLSDEFKTWLINSGKWTEADFR